MIEETPRSTSNRLLARLAEQDPNFTLAELEYVELPLRTALAEPGQAISHVYFLDEGITSVVARSPEGLNAEAGFIGREGFVTPSEPLVDLVHGVGKRRTSGLLCQIQLAGRGHRITVPRFREALEASRRLEQFMSPFRACRHGAPGGCSCVTIVLQATKSPSRTSSCP